MDRKFASPDITQDVQNKYNKLRKVLKVVVKAKHYLASGGTISTYDALENLELVLRKDIEKLRNRIDDDYTLYHSNYEKPENKINPHTTFTDLEGNVKEM